MTNEKSAGIHNSPPATSEVPSAPPVVNAEMQQRASDGPASTTTPSANAVNQTQDHVGAPNPSPYSEPPPSYQMATNYPTTPYPNAGMPSMPGAVPPSYLPKPPSAYPPAPNQPPMYYPTQGIGVAQYPQGERIPVTTAQVVVSVGNGFTCPHCNVGIVTKETDMCCMLCLILLTIFTFPFGLVFLCCLPCTVSRRCSNCRRTV
ncbi:unnamed protein product [Cylicocyclus nassatus]|uniref:Membrane protein BRI3 n=1 Tax=Cylicocyclus nassatus TaxID=53992 RepID=A0AA36MEG7_CYLNA|nr:unnamed protein product [Cylicocyclus nassatus]